MADDQRPSQSKEDLHDNRETEVPTTSEGRKQGTSKPSVAGPLPQDPCSSFVLSEGNALRQIRVSVNEDEEQENDGLISNIEIIRDCLDIDGLKHARFKIKKTKKKEQDAESVSSTESDKKTIKVKKEPTLQQAPSSSSVQKENLTSKSVSFGQLEDHKSNDSRDSKGKQQKK